MKIFKKLNLAAILAASLTGGLVTESQAQDARFSQYYSAPMRVNPAMTGMFEGNWRVGANYRSQWGAVLGKAYNTFAVNADMKLAVGQQDFIGLGFNATSDIAGSSGYQQTDFSLNFSFQKRLSKTRRRYGSNKTESFLSAGGQIGLGQRGVKWSNLTYSTQYNQDNNNYDPNVNSGESLNVRTNKLYPDMSAGLMWSANYGRRTSAYVGASAYHINRPDVSLFNEAPRDSAGHVIGSQVEHLYMRWVMHAGGEFLVGGKKSSVSLMPGAVAMFQGPSMELNFGLSMRYQAPKFDDFSFRIGVWSRLANQLNFAVGPDAAKVGADALIFLVGLDYRGLQFMFSYDATVSSLQSQVNGRGGMEFSVIYVHDGDHKRGQGCPTF